MNLVMASVLLLAMLAFQPTLIYGTKNLAASAARSNGHDTAAAAATATIGSSNSGRKAKSSKYGKRHAAEALHPLYSPALSSASKLVLSMESGDVLVRAARGAAVDKQNPAAAVGASGSKRQKNSNSKKLNKNLSTHENGSAATSASAAAAGGAGGASTTSATGRKHLEKKFSATSGLSSAQQQQQPANNKGKQRQMLKSQNHQGKRSGNNGGGNNKAIRENGEMLQGEGEKTPGCRYAKSVWTECDAKTNMRSRTLSLKKGDASCQQTRTMQKKCKKSCRYEKGAWSECINGQMTREDKVKATGGSELSSCEAVRSINRKCNPHNGGAASKQAGGGGGKKERKNKDKGSRRNQAQQQQQHQAQEQQQP